MVVVPARCRKSRISVMVPYPFSAHRSMGFLKFFFFLFSFFSLFWCFFVCVSETAW